MGEDPGVSSCPRSIPVEECHSPRSGVARAPVTRGPLAAAGLPIRLRQIVQPVAESMGSTLGAVWLIDPGSSTIRCVAHWSAAALRLPGPGESIRAGPCAFGEGLAGRVWRAGEPVRMDATGDDDPDPLVAAAARAGLRSAVCYPNRNAEVIVGVVALFSREPARRDAELSGSMLALALRLGECLGCTVEEEAVRVEELRGAILDSALDCFVVIDHEGRITEFNGAAERTFGLSRADALGRVLADTIIPPELREGHRADLERCVQTGESRLVGVRTETIGMRADGSRFPVELAIARIGRTDPPAFVASLRDITERRKREEALRESQERYRLLFESCPHPLWVLDAETRRFLAVNETAVTQYGWSREELLDMTVDQMRIQEEAPTLEGTAAAALSARRTWKHRTRDGRLIDVEVSWRPFRLDGRRSLLEMAIDVTDRRHLEDQLRWSQRMEAVGRLAGGVAHDFNNILTAISGYSQLLELRLGPDHPLGGEAKEIRKAAERAAGLTRQLLAFSRRQELRPRPLRLDSVVAEMEKMLRRLIGEDIEVTISLGGEPAETLADPGQIEQVLLNLAINARDAMPHGGHLAIETSTVHLDETYAARHVDVKPGWYVMLSVSDTGCGMTREVQSHIFEPFFTTKTMGKGTGLGLSTVYGIVKQTGGDIRVYSEPALGTTFKVYLPLNAPVAPAGAGEEVAPGPRETPRGTETILVVEDEDLVRQMVSRTLERSGYRVLEACLGAEALKIGESHPGPVDLMVTDVVIPQMSGSEIARRLAAVRPGIKVMYMSGYAEGVLAAYGVPTDQGVFLEKPFSPDTLARKVREILDR